MSAMMASFYLRWRNVGTEFSQETAASDSDDLLMYSVIVIQISVSLFVHIHLAFLSSSPILTIQYSQSIRHCGITYHLWHFKCTAGQGNNHSWKGPGQSEDLIQSQSHQAWFD